MRKISLIFVLSAMYAIPAQASLSCDGMTRRQCEALIAELEQTAAYIQRKSKENEAATNAALNKCIARLPENFSGKQLVDCMARDIGR